MAEDIIEILKSKVRPVTEDDRKHLLKVSYSRLDCLKQCPYKYFLKYVKGNYSDKSAIALEVGTLCHSVMEDKGLALIKGEAPRTEIEARAVYGGDIDQIEAKYWDSWNEIDKSGMTYPEKFEKFFSAVYPKSMSDPEWTPYACEHEFEFVFDNRVIIGGFIDRVDMDSEGHYKVTDYKTANHVYEDKDVATAAQMFIYGLAILNEFGELPAEYEYDFIFLDAKKQAMTKGYEKRGLKALEKIVTKLFELEENRAYVPSATPLCHWCCYSGTCDSDPDMKGLCDFYSLWTRENKTFSVNQQYGKENFDADMAYNKKAKLEEIIW